MSTLALLVVLLVTLVSLILVTGLGFVVHHRPALAVPVTVALAGAGVLTAVVFGIIQSTGQ
ncbi:MULTISPECIES: hypothetical protein [unclassified Streptomyces]|uniref:hypothetical protein n=1 Tax=unclassified Streptomyces TaxID=2593676 RepID=UPI0036AB2920